MYCWIVYSGTGDLTVDQTPCGCLMCPAELLTISVLNAQELRSRDCTQRVVHEAEGDCGPCQPGRPPFAVQCSMHIIAVPRDEWLMGEPILQLTLCIVLQLNINVTNGKAKLRSQEDE